MIFPTTQDCVLALSSMLVMQALWTCCFYFLEFPLLESSKSGLLFASLCSNAMSSEVCPNHSPNKGATPWSQHFPSPFVYLVFHSIHWHVVYHASSDIVYYSSLPLSLQLELRLYLFFCIAVTPMFVSIY